MKRFCPLSMASDTLYDCRDYCMLYDKEMDGCLLKQAIKTYINSHKPVQAYTTAPKAKSIPAYDSDDMTGLVLCP